MPTRPRYDPPPPRGELTPEEREADAAELDAMIDAVVEEAPRGRPRVRVDVDDVGLYDLLG